MESLYNIQNVKAADGSYWIASTVFSDLTDLLSLNATTSDSQNIPKTIEKNTQLEEPKCDISNLSSKHKNIKKDLELIQRIKQKKVIDQDNKSDEEKSDTENEDEDLTQNTFIPIDSDIPKFCKVNNVKRHQGSCNKHCYYSIKELKTLAQSRLIDELSLHGHPKTLMKKKKKYFSTEERRQELIEHYKIYHKKQ